MAGLTNILCALMISLAPGLSMGRLVHALDVCHTHTESHQTSHTDCPDDHDEPEKHTPGDCPCVQSGPALGGAIAVSGVVTAELACVPETLATTDTQGAIGLQCRPVPPGRPPTGPPLVGATILRI